jgi:hypothetical protein
MAFIFNMNKQHPFFLTVTLALLLLGAQGQSCSASTGVSTDLLESGIRQVFNSGVNIPQNREHRYTFSVGFSVPSGGLQVAACTFAFTQPSLPSM